MIGALDGDGTYNKPKARLEYTSASIEYGYDLMALLATVGIESNYRIRKYKQPTYSDLIEVQFKCIHGVIEDLVAATIRYDKDWINFGSFDGVKLPIIYRTMLNIDTAQARVKQDVFGVPMSLNGWYNNGKMSKANANHIVQNMSFFSCWTNYLLGTKKVETVENAEDVDLY
ncbi:MAG: LAGLIDADG family homing endonuclease, partial [Candidatus Heimdallarchaeota archaeon]